MAYDARLSSNFDSLTNYLSCLYNGQIIDTFTQVRNDIYSKMLIISPFDVTNIYNNLGCKLNYFYTI
jgi:hypothetical protein